MKHNLHRAGLLRPLLLVLSLIIGSGGGKVWAETHSATLNFGTATGSIKISAQTVTCTDELDNEWAISTSGTTSFTQNATYSQVGSSSKPATSITFTTTLPSSKNITAFSARFGGFSNTAGAVTLKVDDTTVGTGSLNATNDVTVSSTSAVEGTVLTISVTDIAKGVKCYSISYTYEDSSSSGLTASDFVLTGAPAALNFDLYNNSTAQVISYSTSSTGAVTVSESNYVTTTVDETAKTITVTPVAVTPSDQTITVSQAADDTYEAGSTTFKVTITDSTPIPTHTATFSVNGSATTQDFEEGAAINFPSNPEAVNGKVFVGWAAAAIDGTTNTAPTFVTSATMGNADVTYYAVFASSSGGSSATVTDVLTNSNTINNSTATTYSEWTYSSSTSGAEYAGQSAGSNNSIQLRSNNNNSGIVTTTSGGKATKVVINWNANTTNSRVVSIYGKNSAYSSPVDLYSSSTQGTLLGEYTYDNTNGQTDELTISGNYAYIGIRSKSGALYLNSASIEWTSGTPASYSNYCTTVVAAAVARPAIEVTSPFNFTTTATISCETQGATIYYRYSEDEDWQEYSQALTLTSTTTIYAKAVNGDDESTVASVTATKELATTAITLNSEGITNTNVYDGTAAGTLIATVSDASGTPLNNATVTWTSSNENVATVADGVVTLVAAGTTTITASFAATDDYAASSQTYELTVTNDDPNAPGTENNPYTVAEALAASASTGVYVRGIVSRVVSTSVTSNGQIRYYISDDGSTTGEMNIYNGKGIDGAAFTSIEDIQVGDVVVVTGEITVYQNANQLAANNQLVSLQRTAPVAIPTFSPAAGAVVEGTEVTITCATEGATIYYTTDDTEPSATNGNQYAEPIPVAADITIKAIAVKDGMNNSAVATAEYTINLEPSIVFDGQQNPANEPYTAGNTNVHYVASNLSVPVILSICDANGDAATYDWFSAELNGETYVHIAWQANDGEARTAYFKLVAGDTSSEIFSVTQAAFVADFATLPFAFDGGRSDIEDTDGLTYSGLGTDYGSSPKLKFDSTDDCLILKLNERPGTLTFDIKGNGFSGGTFKVQTSANGTTYTDLQTYTTLGDTQSESFDNLAADVRYIKWIYTEKNSGNVALGNIAVAEPGSAVATVATPTFSPEAGTYTSAQSVTITCATEGATIYYTLDGEDPTTESTAYREVIPVDATVTIKAIAVKEGLTNSAVATAEYTIDLTPSIVFDGQQNPDNEPYTAGSTNIHYVASNLTDAVTLVICDSEGAATTCDWFTAEITSNVYVHITWEANDDTENTRTAYFKLVAGNTESAIFSVTQAKFVADYATLPFSFDGGKNDIATTSGLTQEGLDTDYSSSPKLKFNSAGDYVILQLNEAPGTLTFDIKGNSFSSSTFKVQTSEDGVDYTDLESYTELDATQHESFDNLSSDVRYIKWIYTTKASGNVALGNIAVTAASSAQTPSIVVSTQTTNPHSGDAGTAVIGFTKYNTNENVDQVIFYSDNAGLTTTTQPDWITNVSIDNQAGTVTLTMARNDGENAEARTAYLRVTAGETRSATTFITQGVYVVDYATLPFEWEGGTSSELTAVTGVTASGLGSDYNETHDPYLVKLDGDGDYIQVKTDSQPGKVTIGVKMIGGGNTSTITVQESSNGSTFTNVETLTISGSSNDELELETTESFAAETRYVRLLFTKGSNVGVGPISIAQYEVPTPAITPETTTVNLYAVSYESKVIKLTYNFIDTNASAPTVVFCDSEGGALTADPDWISDATVADSMLLFNVAFNQYASARTAYMKVQGISTVDGATVSSPIITVTQNAPEYFYVALDPLENINLYVFDTSDYDNQLDFSAGPVLLHGGTTIAISPDPDPGYILNELGVFDDNDHDVRLSGPEGGMYTFELTCDVTIRATAEEIITYTVLIDEGENCTLNVFTDPTFALESGDEVLRGTRIYVSATPDDGYDTPEITVMAGDDQLDLTYDDENEAYYFILQYDVIISAVAAAPAAPSTYALATTITSGKHYIIVGKKNEGYYAMGGQTDNNRTAVSVELNGDRITSNSDVEEFVIYGPYADGNYAIYTEAGDGGYLYAASSSSNYLRTKDVKDANGSWTIGFDASDGFASIVADGSNSRNVMQFNSGSSIFACYGGATQGAVYLYEKDNDVLPEEKPFLSEYGYATWCSKNPLYFAADDEVSAWKVTGVQGENITFERLIGTVPSGTGILLKGQGYGPVTLTSASEVPNASAADVTGNLLVGVADPLKITSGQYYGLYETAFRKLGAGTVPDNRAILPQSISQSGVKAFTFVFNEGGIATGINELDNWTNYNSTIYNLNGQRLAKPQKGFNIINGKKVLFK